MTNRHGSGNEPDGLTKGLEQLRERLARQREPEDPSVLANRVHDDLEGIQERLRQFRRRRLRAPDSEPPPRGDFRV